jgi:hypothetical protein
MSAHSRNWFFDILISGPILPDSPSPAPTVFATTATLLHWLWPLGNVNDWQIEWQIAVEATAFRSRIGKNNVL